jgi:hypothetical protein
MTTNVPQPSPPPLGAPAWLADEAVRRALATCDGLSSPELAAWLLEAARLRVAQAEVPRFVAHTARELLGFLALQLQALERGETDGEAFWHSFRDGLRELETCLAFGLEVAHEQAEALRRFEVLERRVRGRALSALLAGPVEDLLERLRELLHRLETGLYPVADFPHAFDEVAGRLEALLAWQSALADAGDRPGGPAA